MPVVPTVAACMPQKYLFIAWSDQNSLLVLVAESISLLSSSRGGPRNLTFTPGRAGIPIDLLITVVDVMALASGQVRHGVEIFDRSPVLDLVVIRRENDPLLQLLAYRFCEKLAIAELFRLGLDRSGNAMHII